MYLCEREVRKDMYVLGVIRLRCRRYAGDTQHLGFILKGWASTQGLQADERYNQMGTLPEWPDMPASCLSLDGESWNRCHAPPMSLGPFWVLLSLSIPVSVPKKPMVDFPSPLSLPPAAFRVLRSHVCIFQMLWTICQGFPVGLSFRCPLW